MEKVSEALSENKEYLQNEFKNSMDFMMRELDLSGTGAALFALDGLVSKQIITLSILNPLMEAGELPGGGRSSSGILSGQCWALWSRSTRVKWTRYSCS